MVLGRNLARTSNKIIATINEAESWIIAIETVLKSRNGSEPTSERNIETIIKIIPLTPAIPKPGITNTSSSSRTTPVMNNNISTIEASSSMYDEPKNKASAIIPAVPGMPQPGDFISASNPKKPIIISNDATIGLLRNLTTASAQFDSSLIIFESVRLNFARTSSKSLTIKSHIPYFNASSVVSVTSLVESTRSGITTLSSTIPSAISVLLPFFSAVERISERIYD